MLSKVCKFSTSLWSTSALVFLLSGSYGCVTPKEKPRRRPASDIVKMQPSIEKAGQNTLGTETQEEMAPATTEEQILFIKKQIEPGSTFDQIGRNFLTRLPRDPAPGSIAEAAVAVGVVKLSLEQTPSFQEEDLASGNQAADDSQDWSTGEALANQEPETNQYSLENLSSEYGVNLADAFADNILLANPAVMRLAHQAMKLQGNSPRFQEELQSTLSKLAAQWSTSLTAIQPTNIPNEVATEEDTSQIPVQISALRSDDALLAEAQLLADQGQYQEAITKVLSVAENSALKTQADEKLKDFSNMAVQELRRKAAQAFQSAIPIQDIELRKQYLLQAKAYLEEAIKVYPHATYLPTVRDNLREISRDLERLNHQRG